MNTKNTASQPKVASIGDDAAYLELTQEIAASPDFTTANELIDQLTRLFDSKLRAPADQAASVAQWDDEDSDRLTAAIQQLEGLESGTINALGSHNMLKASAPKAATIADAKRVLGYVLPNLKRLQSKLAAPQQSLAPAAAPLNRKEFIRQVVLAVCEIPDRDSPKDQPEMMLVKDYELASILENCFENADEAAAEGQVSAAAPADAIEAAELQTLLMTEFSCYRPTHPAGLMAWARIALLDNSPHRASEGQAQTSAAQDGWKMMPRTPSIAHVAEASYNLNRKHKVNIVTGEVVRAVYEMMYYALPPEDRAAQSADSTAPGAPDQETQDMCERFEAWGDAWIAHDAAPTAQQSLTGPGWDKLVEGEKWCLGCDINTVLDVLEVDQQTAQPVADSNGGVA